MQTEFQSITESVRRISRRFFPIQKKEESLESSIQLLIQNFEMPGSLQINFTSSGTTVALTPFTQTYLIRMVQELIHNALRHSSAWKVWIRLNSEKDGLYLEVEDDGTAFSKLGEFVEMLNNKNNTLRMRADSIGATIKFVRGHKGLLAKIYLPLPQS